MILSFSPVNVDFSLICLRLLEKKKSNIIADLSEDLKGLRHSGINALSDLLTPLIYRINSFIIFWHLRVVSTLDCFFGVIHVSKFITSMPRLS